MFLLFSPPTTPHSLPSTPARERAHATLIRLHSAVHIYAYLRWEEKNHIMPRVWEWGEEEEGRGGARGEREGGSVMGERKPPLQPDCRYIASPPMRDTGSNSISLSRCWISEKERRQRWREGGGWWTKTEEEGRPGVRWGGTGGSICWILHFKSQAVKENTFHTSPLLVLFFFSWRQWIMHHLQIIPQNSHLHSDFGCRPDQVWHLCCPVTTVCHSVK